MNEIFTVIRTVKEPIKKKHFWNRNLYLEHKIKIGLVKSEINAFVDGRVYMKNGTSFSCDHSYEELEKKYKGE